MQVQAIQGYFVEQDRFIPFGSATIPLWKRTIVTFLDEPAQDNVLIDDDIVQRLAALDELNAMVDASIHEEVPTFERAQLHREVDL